MYLRTKHVFMFCVILQITICLHGDPCECVDVDVDVRTIVHTFDARKAFSAF